MLQPMVASPSGQSEELCRVGGRSPSSGHGHLTKRLLKLLRSLLSQEKRCSTLKRWREQLEMQTLAQKLLLWELYGISKSLRLTDPKPPQLHIAMRARPPSVKSSQELELEEFEKAPKFKAKPLNKKILQSKGDICVFAHPKPLKTAPKEFHFSTDARLGPPAVTDLFHKHDRNVPRVTIPNPFNLHTEVPPKPEPKPCTRPEGFQLENLARHELEQQTVDGGNGEDGEGY